MVSCPPPPPAPQGTPLPLSPSPVLLLPEVGPEDQGTYSCVATHPSHGPQKSRAISISIIGETSLQRAPGAGGGTPQAPVPHLVLALSPRATPPLPQCSHI